LRILSIHLRWWDTRQRSSAQAEGILCHLRRHHHTGFLKGSSGEKPSQGRVIQIQMNTSTCGEDLTAFGEEIFLPPN